MRIERYKDYSLSEFQIESIEAILNNENVVLSTHTGNGKTLVADFAINECIKNNWQAVYTALIKALSNQKYLQFKREYGEAAVGLVTGDIVINPFASVIVATTEVLRNMIYESPERIKDLKYIILDEIHYLGNEDRGTVWEEVIIFKRPETRIIGLSATIPNLKEVCDWMETIHNEKVRQVYYPDRIVSQQHFYFDKKLGPTDDKAVLKNYKYYRDTNGEVPYRNSHINFIEYAVRSNILPVLFFVFSRKQCEEKANELAKPFDLLDSIEKDSVRETIAQYEEEYPEITRTTSWTELQRLALRGIGYHHAGMLPVLKSFMENLFEKKLVKVLYSTETFAVGINYPVKTVCFSSLRKFDGKSFRVLNGGEYLQMSGRAGRRGIDEYGLVFVMTDYRDVENGELFDLSSVTSEPVVSKFSLSYNTVLGLMSRYNEEEIKTFFQKSFTNYSYMKNLKKTQEEIEKLKNEKTEQYQFMPEDCRIRNINRCPLIYRENKEQLKMLKTMQNRKNTSDKDKAILQKDIDNLSKAVSVKIKKCDRGKQRSCLSRLKEINKNQRALKKKEKLLQQLENDCPENKFQMDMDKKTRVLKALHYIDENKNILPRGQTCALIHVQGLLATELLFDGFFHDQDPDIINAVCAGIVLDGERFEGRIIPLKNDAGRIFGLVERIQRTELENSLLPSVHFNRGICGAMYEWSQGGDFFETVAKTGISEGSFVAITRRTVDLLRQILNAAGGKDPSLTEKLKDAIKRIDRGIVQLGL